MAPKSVDADAIVNTGPTQGVNTGDRNGTVEESRKHAAATDRVNGAEANGSKAQAGLSNTLWEHSSMLLWARCICQSHLQHQLTQQKAMQMLLDQLMNPKTGGSTYIKYMIPLYFCGCAAFCA